MNSKYERRNGRTGEPSDYLNGEGCQGQTGKLSQSVHRSGGVSGDSMLGRVTGITWEVCLHGAQAPTDGTTVATQEVVSVQAEVRVPHSSLEVLEIEMERRGGSCAEESEAKRERGDGPEGIATPALPETATGVRKLQRTLYRQAKSKPKWKMPLGNANEANRRTASESRMREIRPSGSMRGR